MYPPDVTPGYDNWCKNLTEVIQEAEGISDLLNLPIAFDVVTEEKGWDDKFQIIFYMPRKGATFSFFTNSFDKEEAIEWARAFTKNAMTDWFGWDE